MLLVLLKRLIYYYDETTPKYNFTESIAKKTNC